MSTMIEQFKAARRCGTPIIAIRTLDQPSTINLICKNLNGDPILIWDAIRGISARGENGKVAAQALLSDTPNEALVNPVEMLIRALTLPRQSLLIMLNGHFFAEKHDGPIQALANLRDEFKRDRRTVLLLCPAITLPRELEQDVIVLDEPLPSSEQLATIVGETYKAAKLPLPDEKITVRAVDAICGLAPFAAETCCAMSLTPAGLDIDALWERKRQQIEQTPGLSVWRGGEKFEDIGGCNNAKEFQNHVLSSENPQRPRAVVFIDEIEKALAGSGGTDTSGVAQEMLGTLLTFMQDHNASGQIFIGGPGCAKSNMAKAIGNEGVIPTISFDMAAMKGSLVGESNKNLRTALKVIEAVSQGRALFIATCNSISSLPPELRRRFTFGTFYFEIPDAESGYINRTERDAIWKIYRAKYSTNKKQELPEDAGWTGAEIKQCCHLAWCLSITLKQAAGYIVPVSISAKEQIEKLRRSASGKFISAGKPGVFRAYDPADSANERGRSIDVGR